MTLTQSNEAVKILAGRPERVSPYLTRLDLWTHPCRQIDVALAAQSVDCPCCKRGHFEFLERT